MLNKIIDINFQIDTLKEVRKVEKTTLLGKLESVLYDKIVVPCCANLIKADIRMGWRGNPEIIFHIGFWNAEENRIDFASDVDFYFGDEYKHLTINHGCSGYYDITNFYLVKRARMLNYVFDHYTEIEDALSEIIESESKKFFEIEKQINNLSYEKGCIEGKLAEESRKAIENNITIGTVMEYRNAVPLRDRIIDLDKTTNIHTWTVGKVTPKFVTLTHIYQGDCRIKKEALVKEIIKGKITIK